MKDSTLRTLQLIQLYILLEVDKICRNNNINYFLVGGTLLGAVRHNGFIPWDDDIDIGMLRSDYNKFLTVCNTELSLDRFTLQNMDTDSTFAAPMTKVRLNGTKRVDRSVSNIDTEDGIDIDIFPYDNFPSSHVLQFIQYYWVMMLRGAYSIKCKCIFLNIGNSLIKKNGMYISTLWAFIFSKSTISKMLDSAIKKYNTYETKYMMSFGGAYPYYKEKIEHEKIENLSKLMFEDYLLPVPVAYDEYLKNIYGDYMTLPPESQRQTHHQISILDLGRYENIVKLLANFKHDG